MANDVAIDIHGNGESCDMRRRMLDMHSKSRRHPAEALRPDPKRVDLTKKPRLKRRVSRITRRLAERARECALREKGASLKVRANPNANRNRRTRVAPCKPNALEDEANDVILGC